MRYITVQKAGADGNLCSDGCEGLNKLYSFHWQKHCVTQTRCSYPSLIEAAVFDALKKIRHNKHWT